MKKAMKWGSNLLTGVMFLIFIVMLFMVISSKAAGGEPQFFGYQLKSVLSGSMEPGIKTGSIIAVKPVEEKTKFMKGDVITFLEEDNMLITHRVIDVVKSGEYVMYTTKGDNNKAADMDPVLSQNVVAEYTGFTVPYVGYFVNFAQSKNGSVLLLILPGLLLLGYSALTIWQAISQIDKKASEPVSEAAEKVV